MKEIEKVFQKLSREQESAPAAAAAAAATQAASATAAAYEPEQKHNVTPGIPGWLNYTACYISGMYSTIRNYMNRLSQSSNLWNAITALILGTPICVIRAWVNLNSDGCPIMRPHIALLNTLYQGMVPSNICHMNWRPALPWVRVLDIAWTPKNDYSVTAVWVDVKDNGGQFMGVSRTIYHVAIDVHDQGISFSFMWSFINGFGVRNIFVLQGL